MGGGEWGVGRGRVGIGKDVIASAPMKIQRSALCSPAREKGYLIHEVDGRTFIFTGPPTRAERKPIRAVKDH